MTVLELLEALLRQGANPDARVVSSFDGDAFASVISVDVHSNGETVVYLDLGPLALT